MELEIFKENGWEVRAINRAGEPWFVAKDVAEALGYKNPHDAIRSHCKGVSDIRTPSAGGIQRVKIIPERDVYRLIMRSKLPAAEQFEEWVVGEILPSIRKKGGYMVAAKEETPEQIMARALVIAQDALKQRDKQLAAATRQLESASEALEFHEYATNGGTEWTITDVKNEFGMSLEELRSSLRSVGFFRAKKNNGRWWPKPKFFDCGYLSEQEDSNYAFTKKGMDWARVLVTDGIIAATEMFDQHRQPTLLED